jgi:hypothetical protein
MFRPHFAVIVRPEDDCKMRSKHVAAQFIINIIQVVVTVLLTLNVYICHVLVPVKDWRHNLAIYTQ